MADFLYKPSEWGALFHSLNTHEALGAGAAGPGKSMVLLFDPLQQLDAESRRCLDKKHPYHIGWGDSEGWALHLRRESVMLDQTLERAHRFFTAIDPDLKYSAEHMRFTFRCGFKYQFGHCKDPGDWEKYQSNQYTYIGYDELTQFTKEQYMQINTRLRTSDPVLKTMLKIRAMSNPFCKFEGSTKITQDVHWVRERFVDPHPSGKKLIVKKLKKADGTVIERTRIYLPATLYDNPDKEFVRQYEENLLDKPEHIRQAMLYGNWYVAPGSHYGDDWNPQIHVCKPFKIPSHWRRTRAMDWGYKSLGVVLWGALDEEDTLYVEREFSFRMMKVPDVCKRIKAIEKEMGIWVSVASGGRSGIPGFADTQIWEERGETGKQKAQEFQENGIYWQRADKRSRIKNSQRFSARLRDHNQLSTRPGIVFFETCRDSIRTIPVIPSNPNNIEEPMEGGDDHHHDTVMYLCAGVSRDGIGVSKDSVEDLEDQMEDPVIDIDRGRTGYGDSL